MKGALLGKSQQEGHVEKTEARIRHLGLGETETQVIHEVTKIERDAPQPKPQFPRRNADGFGDGIQIRRLALQGLQDSLLASRLPGVREATARTA